MYIKEKNDQNQMLRTNPPKVFQFPCQNSKQLGLIRTEIDLTLFLQKGHAWYIIRGSCLHI